MIISTAAALKKHLPFLKFSVVSRYYEDIYRDLGGDLKVVWDNERNIRARSFLFLEALLYRILPLKAFRQFLTRKNNLLREFCSADMVVDISGFALTDEIGLKRMLVFCSGILMCKILGTPFVVYPQSMGPFDSISSRIIVRLFLPMADLIMVRGEQSERHLEKIGIDRKKIHICADSAFLFEPVSSKEAVEILDAHDIRYDNILVGIVPNIRIYDRCVGKGSENTYVALLINIINYFLDELDAQVLLIPFEFKSDGHDDRFLVDTLQNIEGKNSVIAIDKEYSAAELKGIIGHLDLMLASRFHSIVAATSMCVPVVVIGWAHKYVELMKNFGLEEYVVDYRKASSDEIKPLLKKLWSNRTEIVRKLKIEVRKIEKSAVIAEGLVKNLLSST